MPQIDFYLLSSTTSHERWDFICRLIEKIYKQRHRVFIQTVNQTEAHHLDEYLWTYRDDSFLPHHIQGEGPDPAPPIQIGYTNTPVKERDVLINLSTPVPIFYTQFARVLEIVANDPGATVTAREHYRQYRHAGFNITTHKL